MSRYRGRTSYRRAGCYQQAHGLANYLGNIFLLGLATLVGELVNLRAASALEVLLAPFQQENGENLEQDLLATEFGDTMENADLVGLEEQLLP